MAVELGIDILNIYLLTTNSVKQITILMMIRMLPIIFRMNGMIFGLLWITRVYGVEEEGRIVFGCMKNSQTP